jgi:hypothetical protein
MIGILGGNVVHDCKYGEVIQMINDNIKEIKESNSAEHKEIKTELTNLRDFKLRIVGAYSALAFFLYVLFFVMGYLK